MVAGILCSLGAWPASAGPPFVTDDPDPTEYRHWEIYTGFQYENDGRANVSASLPFAEFNYGAMPNVQVSVSTEAYGVTRFGIKTRFVTESEDRPQIAFYPSVQIPTSGHIVTLLPFWLQKSFGPWTTFGGGGLYINPGPGKRDYTFAGGALERTISPGTTLGLELFHQGADTIGGSDTTAANVGLLSQLGEHHAVLFSFGRAFHGPDRFAAYASYEFALGPRSTSTAKTTSGSASGATVAPDSSASISE